MPENFYFWRWNRPNIKSTRHDSPRTKVGHWPSHPSERKGLLKLLFCPWALKNVAKWLKHLETRAPFFFQFLTKISCPLPKNEPALGQSSRPSSTTASLVGVQMNDKRYDFLKII